MCLLQNGGWILLLFVSRRNIKKKQPDLIEKIFFRLSEEVLVLADFFCYKVMFKLVSLGLVVLPVPILYF